MNCKVGGCTNAVQKELQEHALCLDHFVDDIQVRVRGFVRQLEDGTPPEPLRKAANQFVVLTAAKLVTVGIQNPPRDQLARGRLLHAMLLLAELRERLDKAPPKATSAGPR